MRKISDLRVNILLAMRILLAFAIAAALSCGHFQSPSYVSQGEFSTPGEYMSSDRVRRPVRPAIRGPFQLQWPVTNPRISRGFNLGGRDRHTGLDLHGQKNEPIYAAHDGLVIYAGQQFSGYGKMIILEYDQNWASLYGHLNRFRVETGQEVRAGQIIGSMGNTGRSTGVHLHFEVLKSKLPVDPLSLLNSASVASSAPEK